MDYFSKQRGLILAIVVLAILNIATLASIWYTKSPDRKDRRYKQKKEHVFERKLGLSEEQKEKFQLLRETHFREIEPLKQELIVKNKQLFSLMKTGQDSTVEVKSEELAALHKKLEIARYHHFKEMRSFCTPEQQIKFDTIMSNMATRMYSRKSKKRKNKRP